MSIRRKAKVAAVVFWRYAKSVVGGIAFVIAFILACVAGFMACAGVLALPGRGFRVFVLGREVHPDDHWLDQSQRYMFSSDHWTLDACFVTDALLGLLIVGIIWGCTYGLWSFFTKVKADAKAVNDEIDMKENPHLFAVQEKGQLSLDFDGEHSLSLADSGTLSLAEGQCAASAVKLGS